MSGIQHLCDHRVIVYRATVFRDEFGDVDEAWVALTAPVGLNARPNQAWSGNLQDPGPGEQQRAMRQWFLVLGFDVQERDVVSVVSGPEVGQRLRVESVTRPTNPLIMHHLEISVTVWDGSLTESAVAS